MVKTPEGYLICKNVPLGRVGTMDYLGSELPDEFKLPSNEIFKVSRSANNLFSKATIASFEGKPVTNDHPTNNLTIDTAAMIGRGHVQNVHSDGKYLVGDLYITDNGLINQIENSNKREVSCGYESTYTINDDGTIEQNNIVGNHVAVVNSGRAGHSVAIKDSKPIIEKKKGDKKMKNILDHIFGLGIKKYSEDAEPEEIAKAAKAMDEMKEPVKESVKDEEPAETPAAAPDATAELTAKIDKLATIIQTLVESDKQVHEEAGAKESFDALESELGKKEEEEKLSDEEEESPETQAAEKAEGKEKHIFTDDAEEIDDPIKKIVKDMRPKIMAIKDKSTRDEIAKQFVQSVRDSCPIGRNQYSQIIKNTNANRKSAQDHATVQGNISKAAEAANNWANYGKTLSKEEK
ncbi:MAG: DUF2213 domain-containing protein [Parabacteroides sp.]